MGTPGRSPLRLLLVDDDNDIRQMLGQRFSRQGVKVTEANCGKQALQLADKCVWDVALLDLHLPDTTGLDLLRSLKDKHPELEAIVLTAHGSIETAIQAMKQGAYDYLTKPFQFADLEVHVQKAYEKVALARRARQWSDHLAFESPRYRLIGSSLPMRRVLEMIEKTAATDATVLIRGASGTGKELVARALHYNSARKARPLVTVNCAALQESLLESEMFGHEKGAFTGAIQTKRGLIEVAEGGTLFIDEVAEMSPGLQAKLLRVLEDGHYRRVGAIEEASADVRILAATNKPLEEDQKAGRFREDLYYRLNVITIALPSLRERKEDIPELVEHFLSTRQIGALRHTIEPEALRALLRYDWPGNVRELANVIERAQILAENQTITLDDLPEHFLVPTLEVNTANPSHLCEVERKHVLSTLAQEHGNKVRAAKALGISRRALYRLLEKYRIEE